LILWQDIFTMLHCRTLMFAWAQAVVWRLAICFRWLLISAVRRSRLFLLLPLMNRWLIVSWLCHNKLEYTKTVN
jgi:hypothetical protein